MLSGVHDGCHKVLKDYLKDAYTMCREHIRGGTQCEGHNLVQQPWAGVGDDDGVNVAQEAKYKKEQVVQMLIGGQADTTIMPPPAIRASTYMQAASKHLKNARAVGSKSSKTPGVDSKGDTLKKLLCVQPQHLPQHIKQVAC